ncbi:MAG: FCD domain-containing protein [Candidatus Limnocylindrales bacterium]
MSSEVVVRGGYHGRGLHGTMVERLGRLIVAGEPPPGEALPREPVLAVQHDVSRTVVREALRVLAAKGLVDARPMRGTLVRPRSEWRLLDPDLLRWALESEAHPPLLAHLFEIREMVEPTAARLAASRARSEQRAELADALERLVEASGDLGAFIEADLVLHETVFRLSGNPLLHELIAPIAAALRLGRHVQASGAGRARRTLADAIGPHRAVVEAVVAGEPAAAEAAMREVVTAAAEDARRARGRSAR